MILTRLIDLKEEAKFQSPENYLMSAIAWFKLKQFKLSDRYLQEAISKTQADDHIHRTALLWKAMAARAQGHETKAQEILMSMVARFPHSEEVQWVNGSRRAPASRTEREIPEHVMRKVDSDSSAEKNKSMSKQRKHRSAFLTFLIVGVGVTGISKGTDSVGIPCGVVTKVGHGAQIIPPHGKVQVKFEVDQPVVCGSMVITHHETVWVRSCVALPKDTRRFPR